MNNIGATPKKEKLENISWFLCPKCKNKIPLISHFYSEELKKWQLEIRCSCQNNSSFCIDINEYLKSKNQPKNIKEILFIDYIENGLENKGKNFYCKKCDKILSENLLEKHKLHTIINLIDEAKKVDEQISNLDSDFYKVRQNFEVNNEIAKSQQIFIIDGEIEKLKNMKIKVENSFKKNQEINRYFIEYVHTIIKNYKYARKLDEKLVNYSVLSNLINNTEFNMNKFETSDKNVLETSEKLCMFFSNNFIIRKKINSLITDQEINHQFDVNTICKITKDAFAIGEGGINKENFGIYIYKREKGNNEYKLFKHIEKAHSGEITSLCKITINDNDYLLSGDSGDKLINIWEIKKNFRKVMYLAGHKRKIVDIISLKKINDYKNWIASCSTGLNIKLWDLSDIKNFQKISNNYNNNQNSPESSSSNISNHSAVKGPEITYSMKGHLKSIRCIYQMNDGTLVSSSNDKKLKFWNIDKRECFKSIDNVSATTNQSICELDNNRLIVGCFGVIKLINVNNSIIEMELGDHEVWINSLCLTNDGLLFSGDSEGILMLWDLSGEGKKIYSMKKNIAIKNIILLTDNKILIGLLNSTIVGKYK